MQHIAEHRGGKPRRIRVDDDKQRLIRQNLRAELYEGEQIILQLPHFPAGAAAVARRIHDDGVVHLAAADLALDKLCTVVDDPAHGRVAKAADTRILTRPVDHALCRVHMADLRARRRTRDRRAAGISKKVQHADGTIRIFDFFARKIPVDGLLGEKPRVLEVHGLDLEFKILVAHDPALRQLILIPVSAAGGRAMIPSLCVAPAAIRTRRLPDRLRIRSHQNLLSPAFEFFSAAAVQQLIIFPTVRDPHTLSPLPHGHTCS